MYRDRKERLAHEIIINSSIFVEEAISYDNWNNETYKHNVILFLNEFIESLWIELADDSNLDYQSSVKFTSQPIVNPNKIIK